MYPKETEFISSAISARIRRRRLRSNRNASTPSFHSRPSALLERAPDEEWHSKTEWHRVIAWNGLGEYAAAKLRKGDHIYIEGTLVSSVYENKIGKAKNATSSADHVLASPKRQSIRKLNRVKGAQAAETLPPDAEAGDVPF